MPPHRSKGPKYESPDRQVRVRDENVIWSPEGATCPFAQNILKERIYRPFRPPIFFPIFYPDLTVRAFISRSYRPIGRQFYREKDMGNAKG